MDSITLQVLIWLPAIILSLIGTMWYFSFPKRQRNKHNLEALGLVALGVVISLFTWSLWMIYHIQGADSLKVTFADKVVWSVVFGVFGTLTAVAVLTMVALYKRDDKGNMAFRRKPGRKKKKN